MFSNSINYYRKMMRGGTGCRSHTSHFLSTLFGLPAVKQNFDGRSNKNLCYFVDRGFFECLCFFERNLSVILNFKVKNPLKKEKSGNRKHSQGAMAPADAALDSPGLQYTSFFQILLSRKLHFVHLI